MKLKDAQTMDLDQLENVAGGTWDETKRMFYNIFYNRKGYHNEFAAAFRDAGKEAHYIKDSGERQKHIQKYTVEGFLKNAYGIDAKCDIGNQKANRFSYTSENGETIKFTTDEVIETFFS